MFKTHKTDHDELEMTKIQIQRFLSKVSEFFELGIHIRKDPQIDSKIVRKIIFQLVVDWQLLIDNLGKF